jgi:ATP-dependent Lon protease
MNKFNLLISLCLCLICVACVNPTTKQVGSVKISPATNNDASEFLNYAEQYSNLPFEAQKQELATTNQELTINPNNLSQRMKLIMIYGLPSSALLDSQKAQNLLLQLLQENILSNTQLAFGHLVFDHLIAINKANKNIKEDQKRIDTIAQKNEALQLKLDTTLQKLEVIQQKLNDLKNIEKSMSEREVTPRK